MANLHVEPSGHQLPFRNGPSSGEDRTVWRAQLNYPYQLPPPRSLTALPFGVDDHRQQNRLPEGIHPAMGGYSRDRNSTEKLPSVTQLLSPAPPANLPPSPYSQYRGSTPLSTTSSDLHDSLAQSSPHHHAEPSMIHHSNGPYGQFHSQQAGKLPSISQFGIDSAPVPWHDTRSPKDLDAPAARGHLPSCDVLRRSPEKSPRESPPAHTKGTKDGSLRAGSQRPAILPHVVDERYIEGEGLCYIYADGSYCPKTIDGEPVNANWGVTKAGKPRKRLAQACVTCREKKIKCQPNLPKCDQCQKSGRECRFESAPRGNHSASRSASYEPQPTRPKFSQTLPSHSTTPNSPHGSNMMYTLPRASGSASSLPGPTSQSPVSERQFTPTTAPDVAHGSILDLGKPPKRRRRGSVGSAGSSKSEADFMKIRNSSSDRADILLEVTEQESNDAIFREWASDPIEVDPEATVHYVDRYFACVNDGIFQLLPRKPFLLWMKSCRTKSLDDKMLLYSVLALGSIFSDRPERIAAGKRFFTTAKYAVDKSQHRLTLQLAQSRIILSLWYSAIGALTNAWDFIGAAARTVCGLRYNVEPDGPIIGAHQVCEYGLHPQALIECHRRTFWAVFILDRFSAFYSLSPLNLPSDDIFLRLPCHEDIYEAQQYVTVPYFQNKMNDSGSFQSDRSGFGLMAVLIEIISLWGEVSSHIGRSAHMPRETYRVWFEGYYASVMKQAEHWMNSLPRHCTYNTTNMENSMRSGRADHFVSIHMLYHATLLRLNRHVRHENLPEPMVDSNIRRTRYHATEILRMSLALGHFNHESRPSRPSVESFAPRTMLSTPYISYAILSAADVLSAFGFMADLSECISLLNGGLDIIDDICRFWDIARPQSRLLNIRANSLATSVQGISPTVKNRKLGFALDGPSMDAAVYSGSLEHNRTVASAGDLIYDLPLQRHFKALGMEEALIHSDNILLIKETRG
ncbi:hypothetical protein VTN77DRAFT_2583 [Rasamsonia byssochlamydoides]|uniref:uncharacterized protein n=1 Tax=Rasamsonia byssochlamydoides TaxID=89139 RepID=UPI0037433FD1